MKKVLILIPYYFPGYKSGGPQRTVSNLVKNFHRDAEIYILTQNIDLGEQEPYRNVEIGKWLRHDGAFIKYLDKQSYRYKGILQEYFNFDIIYSCELFRPNTIAILAIHRLKNKNKKIYVAPMGVFSEKAFSNKGVKKKIFISIYKVLGMFKSVIWSFTSEIERKEAMKYLGKSLVSHYIIAEDFPEKIDFESNKTRFTQRKKERKILRIVFVSRICQKKNLDFCVEVLSSNYVGKIYFDVYGIIEDRDYWKFCLKHAEKLKENVHMNYCGPLMPGQAVEVMMSYDLFFFPTKGENFGHVIYEALCAGCIPVISDTTPWMDLDQYKAGCVIRYGVKKIFYEKICEFLEMDEQEIMEYRVNAVVLAKKKYKDAVENSGYREVFLENSK